MFTSLVLEFLMECSSCSAECAQNRSCVSTRHPEQAELITESWTVLRWGLFLTSVTIHSLSINPKNFHNTRNPSYTNQLYVDEGQIYPLSSFKSSFLCPSFHPVWMMAKCLQQRNGPCWSCYLWHYSARAMGWTPEGTAESFGKDRRANWSGKLWGQHWICEHLTAPSPLRKHSQQVGNDFRDKKIITG